MRLRVAVLLLSLFWASPALAVAMSLDFFFSGEIVGGDNPTYTVKSKANFSFDDACLGTTLSFCDLTITLTALPSPDGAAPSQGEVLTSLLWDALGGADFRDGPPGNVPWPGGSAIAAALEGSGAATALGEIGLDVSGHWGLNPAVAFPGRGSHLLGSTGDVLGTLSTLGSMQMFSTNPADISSIEPAPPDGATFGILDAASSSGGSGWPMGSIAYVQDNVVATLKYTGTLTGVDNVEPLYGTDGRPIPEPGTVSLLALGLLGLALGVRRR